MRRKTHVVFVLFLVSGFAGLIYEAIWTHYVKLFLGHAAYAQTLVLVVFIGGLALGAWLCARFTERLQNPLRLYAMVELAIGLGSLVFHRVFVLATDWGYASLLPATCDPAQPACLPQWLLSAALLLPQSILLGATFPLVTAAALRIDATRPGHDVAALYFLNSLGAVFGVLAAAFFLIPEFGLPGTLRFAASANLLLALAALLLSREPPKPLSMPAASATGVAEEAWDPRWLRLLLLTAFLTGLSSFIYEIAWIRMLSLVLGASTHSFELMLASFILGLALGGAWVRNRVDIAGGSLRMLAMVQLAMGIAAAATIPVYNKTFDVMSWILSSLARNDAGFLLFSLSSSVIALLVMLPATFCAGMTLPLITYRLMRSPSGERALGLVYAVNTLGSIVGVVIAVHLLLSWIGVRGTILVGAVIDVGLAVLLLLASKPHGAPRRLPAGAIAALLGFVLIAVAFDVDPRRSASGVFRSGVPMLGRDENLLYHRDGKTATVSLVEIAPGGVRSIRTNGKPDASINMTEGKPATIDEFTMTLLAALPLGHRPDARTAAVIGFGSGMSTATLLASPRLQRVDTIEIEPAMVEAAQHFRPVVEAAYADPRSRIVIDDAKSYFARGRERYDIIVSEPSNPWVSGVSSLFAEEFYARLSNYLSEGGVLAQWLHTYDMDAETLASILGAVSKTFPEYAMYSSVDFDLILIARKGGPAGQFDAGVLSLPALQPMLSKLKLTDPASVQRRLVGGSGPISRHFATYGVRSNSDYFPVVDQRSSKTRFTNTRMAELTNLQASPVPVLEMLAGAPVPSAHRVEVVPTTFTDTASRQAWDTLDILLPPAAAGPVANRRAGSREMAAELVRFWSGCESGLAFGQALPAMVVVAETVNPWLPPEVATRVWDSIAKAPCARTLPAADRLWLEMFDAIARRDAAAMLRTSTLILEASRGEKNPASEMAFLAAATAGLCRGNGAIVRTLLDSGRENWLRPNVHLSELRFIEGLLLASKDAARPACAG
ncbi:MAG TPA: fused MFS/spermidine synthase [Usitatibacter sp.]|nr:fused MFS/spermidine synthase [Usitatibacter sp.]